MSEGVTYRYLQPVRMGGGSNRSIFDVTLISKKGKRYENGVDIEEGGEENKKIRKSKRPKRKIKSKVEISK